MTARTRPAAWRRAVAPLQAAGGGLAVLGCLAEEWQQAVDAGLGDQDLTVVARVLGQQGATP